MGNPTGQILAIDIGTSSIRAAVFAADGRLIRQHSTPTPTQRGPAGTARLDAAETWKLTAQAVRAIAPDDGIVAVGIAAQLGMVLLNADGEAVSPVYLWSDRSAAAYVDDVADALAQPGAPAIARRLAAESSAARLRMLTQEDAATLERAAAVVSFKDFIVASLTGALVTDPTHASYSALFDVVERAWSPSTAEELGIPARLLPDVRAATAVAGVVSSRAAGETGLAAGIAVAVGGPDGTIGALGAGAVRAGTTVDIAGSTDVLVHVVDRAPVDPLAVVTTNAYVDDPLWTVGGATGMTGATVDWLAEMLGFPDVSTMHDDLQPELGNDADGVMVDPALTGHRYPYWDLTRVGRIAELTPLTRRGDLLAAVHRGNAFVVGDGIRALEAVGERPSRVIVVGGVARRPQSLQLRADVWGLPVSGVDDGLATSRGAAMLGAVAAGLFPTLQDAAHAMVVEGRVFDPDATRSFTLQEQWAAWTAEFAR